MVENLHTFLYGKVTKYTRNLGILIVSFWKLKYTWYKASRIYVLGFRGYLSVEVDKTCKIKNADNCEVVIGFTFAESEFVTDKKTVKLLSDVIKSTPPKSFW